MRHHSEARPTSFIDDCLASFVEQARITMELIDHEPFYAITVTLGEDCMGAHQGCDDATTVDVTDQDGRHVRGFCKTHVCEIAIA